MSAIIRWWTTCEDGIPGLDPAPPGKGNWVKYTDHVAAVAVLENALREAIKADCPESISMDEYLALVVRDAEERITETKR